MFNHEITIRNPFSHKMIVDLDVLVVDINDRIHGNMNSKDIII